MSEFKCSAWKNIISHLLGDPIYIKALYLVMLIFSHFIIIQEYITPFNKLLLLYGILVISYDLLTNRNILRNRYFLLLAAVCFFIGLSIVINFQEGFFQNVKGYSYLIVEFFVIAAVFPGKSKEAVFREFKILAMVSVASLSVLGVAALYTFAMGIQIPLEETGRLFIGISPDSRLFGVSGNPNMLGLQMMFLLMLVLALFVLSDSKKRWWLVFPGLLGVICLMLSGSRGAQLAFLVAFGFFVFFSCLQKCHVTITFSVILKKLLLSLLVVVISVSASVALQYAVGYIPPAIGQIVSVFDGNTVEGDNETVSIKEDPATEKDGSEKSASDGKPAHIDTGRAYSENTKGGSGRLDLWRTAWEIFKNHPLFGVGNAAMNSYGTEYMEGTSLRGFSSGSVHNIYLQVLAASGIFAFISFMAMIVFFAVKGLTRIFAMIRDHSRDTQFFICIICPIIMILVHELFEMQMIYVSSVTSAMFAFYLGYFQYMLQKNEDESSVDTLEE